MEKRNWTDVPQSYEKMDVNYFVMKEFEEKGEIVERGEWQAITDDRPQMKVYEISTPIGIQLKVPVFGNEWGDICQPNLPWAEDHFLERVSGVPYNPPPSASWWPYAQDDNKETKNENDTFSHSYPERYWPKFANHDKLSARRGVRFQYGDLNNLVSLLIKRPMTRQAYLPVWFPEDLFAADQHGERVPCSLGYHFLMRPSPIENDSTDQRFKLECYYTLRSCDFYRYMWDDIYMAGRLLQWIAKEVSFPKRIVVPDILRTEIINLHVFADEKAKMDQEFNQSKDKRLYDAFS